MSAGLSGCDYYRGVGGCSTGASCGWRGEPVCVTDEPREGWAIESKYWWVRRWSRVRFLIRNGWQS